MGQHGLVEDVEDNYKTMAHGVAAGEAAGAEVPSTGLADPQTPIKAICVQHIEGRKPSSVHRLQFAVKRDIPPHKCTHIYRILGS